MFRMNKFFCFVAVSLYMPTSVDKTEKSEIRIKHCDHKMSDCFKRNVFFIVIFII